MMTVSTTSKPSGILCGKCPWQGENQIWCQLFDVAVVSVTGSPSRRCGQCLKVETLVAHDGNLGAVKGRGEKYESPV